MDRLRSFKAPLLLGMLCFLIYNCNLRTIGSGDTLPARFLPLILWQQGTFELQTSARLVAHGHSATMNVNRPAGADGRVAYFEPWAYWMVRTPDGRIGSLYPVVAPLMVAPLYVPAVIWLNAQGWEQPRIDRVAELMEKISAALLASLASVVLYLVLRREGSRWSLPLALAFAFGTNTWMISSQALWQHGAGELLIAIALLLVVSAGTPLRAVLLGAVCVCIAANRPPDALIAGAIAVFATWRRRGDAAWIAAGAALPLAALLYYNLDLIGHIAGGYAAAGTTPKDGFFRVGWTGVPGLLVSPARGLLIFSPFLALVPMGLVQRFRAPGTRGLAIALSVAVIGQILVYSQADWRAGVSWGPRWLTDLLPILVWMLAPAPLALRPLARAAFGVAIAGSIVVQAIGAFWYTGASDALIYAGNPSSMRGAWNPANVPFITELRHAPAGGSLQCGAVGSIDRVGEIPLTSSTLIPRLDQGSIIEGWTTACRRTPAQIFLLIDGVIVGSTQAFTPRPDVAAATRAESASGWRLSASTAGIGSGERVLQLAVRATPASSDIRIVREQRVIVSASEAPAAPAAMSRVATAQELDAMAARAAQLLRERQNAAGFWLTSYTSDLHYASPKVEMNTFLTPMLVDVLMPIAGERGLSEGLSRARRHLAAQIESDGLVRYHGLPDASTIGTLGCAITPDADDTALAWRIAVPDGADPRRERMLAELGRYRDARGLYRTWLAARKDYRCLDPGRNPNPTDVTIQMHVYLMLSQLDPPAAQRLCDALRHSWNDGDIWTYYAEAPLVPYLRSAELRQRGCAIPLPGERLALAVAGQEEWVEAARRLVQAAALRPSSPDGHERDAIRAWLARIGNDDFAAIRHAPPLLYHNDLSATVSRFYWSEDFGYALWLRLHALAGTDRNSIVPPASSPAAGQRRRPPQ